MTGIDLKEKGAGRKGEGGERGEKKLIAPIQTLKKSNHPTPSIHHTYNDKKKKTVTFIGREGKEEEEERREKKTSLTTKLYSMEEYLASCLNKKGKNTMGWKKKRTKKKNKRVIFFPSILDTIGILHPGKKQQRCGFPPLSNP